MPMRIVPSQVTGRSRCFRFRFRFRFCLHLCLYVASFNQLFSNDDNSDDADPNDERSGGKFVNKTCRLSAAQKFNLK